MSMHTLPAILRAAVRQAAGDLRPSILGTGIFSLLIAVLPVIVVGMLGSDSVNAGTAFGPMLVAGSIGAFGCFIVLQIAGEMYTDRVGGALLRVRILPHGSLVWAIGKTISTITMSVIIQGAVLIGTVLTRSLPVSAPQILICLPLIVLSAVAAAPLGFLMGSVARGLYSVMITYLAALPLLLTGGSFFPLDWLPRWAQAIQLVLPTYWAGHLTRWTLAGDPAWEIGGAFNPVMAIGILVAWAVVGFAMVPEVIRRSFRKESIGTLSRMQSTIRSQSGL